MCYAERYTVCFRFYFAMYNVSSFNCYAYLYMLFYT